ncbi:hypothetical protein F5888DRAFT_639386 [Russula emetica]|nr:hypothetical protein F5888DRAFT_639386 [Russula emetica]
MRIDGKRHCLYKFTHAAVCRKNFIRRIDQVTNKVSNSPAQTRTGHQISTYYPFTALAPPSFPNRPGTSILIQCRHMGKVFELFKKQRTEEWMTLTHVCRRWRCVVFQSPRRLNLRLFCTHKTHARDILDVWPPLPLIDLIIHDSYDILNRRNGTSGLYDIIAALKHSDRVCQIKLRYFTSLQLKYVTDLVETRKPFPELTDLHLRVFVDNGPGANPSRFVLGRSCTTSAIMLLG